MFRKISNKSSVTESNFCKLLGIKILKKERYFYSLEEIYKLEVMKQNRKRY